VRLCPDLKIPHWPADIDHAGDSASDVAREIVIEVRLDPRNFVFIWADAAEIGAVGPREQVPRLKEMDVGIDQARDDELADAGNLFSERGCVLFAHGDALKLVAIDYDRRIWHHLAIGRIDHGRANQRNLFGVNSRRDEYSE